MCKLDDIVNKYNNTNHGAIKMKRVDVNQRMYIDSNKEINDENLKTLLQKIIFQVVFQVRNCWSILRKGIGKIKSKRL